MDLARNHKQKILRTIKASQASSAEGQARLSFVGYKENAFLFDKKGKALAFEKYLKSQSGRAFANRHL
ncbi:MAG: hypothetical protein JSW63_06545 [Ignavibacterium sp.]|nr:MAG: hypothetical protein JSW63_06545 [Ignavibacterium sp.]